MIDFRTLPDGEYYWILTVQDHCTKFVWLVPLKQKSGQEVAKALYDLLGVFKSYLFSNWRKNSFKLGTRSGVLDKFFAFNAFQKTELVTDFSIKNIPKVEKKDKNNDKNVTEF